MKILKNKKFVKKCLSTAMTLGVVGFSVLAVDGISAELKCKSLKNHIYEESKSAYVEFVKYEVEKLNSQYLDNEITFEDCLSSINELSDEEQYKDNVVEKFATEEESKKIEDYDKKSLVNAVGMIALMGSSMGVCFINDRMMNYGERDM